MFIGACVKINARYDQNTGLLYTKYDCLFTANAYVLFIAIRIKLI